MTYALALKTRGGLRDDYAFINPVTAQPEQFIALQSGHRAFSSTAAPVFFNSSNPVFAAVDGAANTVADPLGGMQATKFAAMAPNASHGNRITALVGGGSFGNLTAGDAVCHEFWIKPGSLSICELAVGGTAGIVARFDTTTGAKISGDNRIRLESGGLNLPSAVATGWYRAVTVGLIYDGTTITQTFETRWVKGAATNYAGNPATDNWYWYGGSSDIKRGYQFPGYPTMGGYQDGRDPDRLAIPLKRFAKPKAMTCFVEFIDCGNRYRGTVGLMRIGDFLGTAERSINVTQNGTVVTATYTYNGRTSISTLALVQAGLELTGLHLTLSGSGAIRLSAYMNTGEAVYGSAGAAVGLCPAWSGDFWHIGSLGNGGNADMMLRKNFTIAGGVQPLSIFR